MMEKGIILCPACHWQWNEKDKTCNLCNFPIANYIDFISGKKVDEKFKRDFEKDLEKHSPSVKIATLSLGHTTCVFGLVDTSMGKFQVVKPPEFLTNEFFGKRGFDFLLFVISLFISGTNIDGISLSLPCEVIYTEEGDPQLHTHWTGWPSNPISELRESLGVRRISVINDAVAFALGCIFEFDKIKEFSFPILCLTLGTGIGCAILQKSDKGPKIKAIELYKIRKWWSVGFEGNPHQLAGAEFFNYVRNHTNWDLEETKGQFSLRIALIIEELKNKFYFNSVLLRGGRTPFVNLSDISKKISKPVKIIRTRDVVLRGTAYSWVLSFSWKKRLSEFIENL